MDLLSAEIYLSKSTGVANINMTESRCVKSDIGYFHVIHCVLDLV